ncbi:hypothetical protein IW148_002605 [Coemansia sp. RSA 1199]|nr:hypothetical protein IW148_002605 [Coemansia sp. RSA 1199]
MPECLITFYYGNKEEEAYHVEEDNLETKTITYDETDSVKTLKERAMDLFDATGYGDYLLVESVSGERLDEDEDADAEKSLEGIAITKLALAREDVSDIDDY